MGLAWWRRRNARLTTMSTVAHHFRLSSRQRTWTRPRLHSSTPTARNSASDDWKRTARRWRYARTQAVAGVDHPYTNEHGCACQAKAAERRARAEKRKKRAAMPEPVRKRTHKSKHKEIMAEWAALAEEERMARRLKKVGSICLGEFVHDVLNFRTSERSLDHLGAVSL